MNNKFRTFKASLVVLVTATAMTSLIACTKNKDNSGTTVVTDGDSSNKTNTTLNMRHILSNGALIIYNNLGQQIAQANNVTRIIGQATENFIAYEAQSKKMGLVRTIFHNSKGVVANCEKQCSITLRKNFASFKLRRKRVNIAVGLINKDGNSFHYSSKISRNGKITPVKLQIGDDFALLTRPNGEKSLINSEQGMIRNAKNVRVRGSFAVANVGSNSYLFNSNNSFQLNNSNDRLNGVMIRDNFAVVDYGTYKRVYHGSKGLIVDACNNCHAYGTNNAPDGVTVGNRDIFVSNNFILIPSSTSNDSAKIYGKDNQALTVALISGSRVKMNDFFAGYSSPLRSELFHVTKGSVDDYGSPARIKLLDNGVRFKIPGAYTHLYDNDGIKSAQRPRRRR